VRAHARLVIENPSEVLLVREYLVLQRQERAARIHQIDAGQVILARDFLCAQVFFHRHREVGAALHRRVVGQHHDFAAVDAANAGDQAGCGCGVVIHAFGGKWTQLQERRAGVEQGGDAIA